MTSTLAQDKNYMQSITDFFFPHRMNFPDGSYFKPFTWPLSSCLPIDGLLAPSSKNRTEWKSYKM